MRENIPPTETQVTARRRVSDAVLGFAVRAQLFGMEISIGVDKEDEPIHDLIVATTSLRSRTKFGQRLERGARAYCDQLGKQFNSPARLGAIGLALVVRGWDLFDSSGTAPPVGYRPSGITVEQYDVQQGYRDNTDSAKDE